jgi:1,4-dihydroxy-2-naphthoyl-CoA hydrolase
MYFKSNDLDKINAFNKNTLMEVLGITCTEVGADYLVSTMPVNSTTHQPAGILHGGATAALIESIASLGSALIVDLKVESPIGLEINANHISSVQSGSVKGIGRIVHKGKTTHIWQVDVYDEATQKLVSTGRMTILILKK